MGYHTSRIVKRIGRGVGEESVEEGRRESVFKDLGPGGFVVKGFSSQISIVVGVPCSRGRAKAG